MLRYADLAARYGELMAYDLLLIIERMARIKGDLEADEEARISRALTVLDKINLGH